MSAELLRRIAADDALLEIGRKAIEDELIEWRDSRLSELTRRNGLVIREADGEPSDIIRFGPETAVRIALKAIADHLTHGVAIPDRAQQLEAALMGLTNAFHEGRAGPLQREAQGYIDGLVHAAEQALAHGVAPSGGGQR